MKLNNIHKIFFLGIGGIGMSALARYFKAIGKEVYGYDKTETELTNSLIKEGINVHYEDNIDFIPENLDLVIYTPAIPKDNLELNSLLRKGHELHKRAEILGLISEESFTIAIAGTHGKTTTSALVAHILTDSGYGCNAFVGGVMTNYNSNFILNKESNTVVVEADEFDKSFLYLKPDISVVTSVDLDHLDIYDNKEDILKGFTDFLNLTKSRENIIVHKNVKKKLNFNVNTYGADKESDNYLLDIKFENGISNFSIGGKLKIKDLFLPLLGEYNLENALVAVVIANKLGVSIDEIRDALSSFKGVKRRFEVHFNGDNNIYIDDYAHHPTEISSFLKAVRSAYKGKRILGIFQPHLYSRTKDFMDEFAASLNELDELWLLPIYPARELPIEGINSEKLLSKVTLSNKRITEEGLVIEALENTETEIVVTMGAGDISRLINPISACFKKKYDK